MANNNLDEKRHAEENEAPPPSYNDTINSTTTPPPTLPEKPQPSSTSFHAPSNIAIIPSGPLTFSIHNRNPFLSPQTITLVPTTPLGPVTSYRMKFFRNGPPSSAFVTRIVSDKFAHERQLAEITYPGELHHPYNVLITFRPSEAEVEAKGQRHVTDTVRLMLVDGYLTTTYGVDLPPIPKGSGRVEWRVLPIEKSATRERDLVVRRDEKAAAGERSSLLAKASSDAAENVERGRLGGKKPWTPFSTQSLVDELTGEVLATFQHSAPFAKETGVLTILQEDETLAPEFVEAIVIVCAAMVGFQDKAGLSSLLVESGHEYFAMKGKNQA